MLYYSHRDQGADFISKLTTFLRVDAFTKECSDLRDQINDRAKHFIECSTRWLWANDPSYREISDEKEDVDTLTVTLFMEMSCIYADLKKIFDKAGSRNALLEVIHEKLKLFLCEILHDHMHSVEF